MRWLTSVLGPTYAIGDVLRVRAPSETFGMSSGEGYEPVLVPPAIRAFGRVCPER